MFLFFFQKGLNQSGNNFSESLKIHKRNILEKIIKSTQQRLKHHHLSANSSSGEITETVHPILLRM